MTVTSNIHIGLSAWAASHVYSLGNRISNSGNAYQCITAGTSAGSGGPTTTSTNITDGTVHWKYLSAIDFSTLGAWTSSIPGTLTQNVNGLLWNDGPITTTSGTPYFSLTGHTVGSFVITLGCAPGESIKDSLANQSTAFAFNSSNGVNFVLPASGVGAVNYVTIADNNVVIDGLQFQDANSSSGCTIMLVSGGGVTVQNCIFDGFAQPGGADMVTFTTYAGVSVGRMNNCLIIDRQAVGSSTANTFSFNQPTGHMTNCTVIGINNPTNGWGVNANGTSGTVTVTNSIIMGFPAAQAVAQPNGATATTQYSLYSNAQTGMPCTIGTGNLFSKTIANQFVNAATDFRLKSGSDALNVGTPDTSDIPSASDIAGTTRPSGTGWDMGAWEFLVAPASVSLTGVSAIGNIGSFTPILPSKLLSGVAAFGAVGSFNIQNVNLQSSMFLFQDNSILFSQNLNGNFNNCVDKTTATPQFMNASLTTAGSLQASNLVTPGMLSVQGGMVFGINVFTTSGSYAMQSSDYIFVANKTVAASMTVILPSNPAAGRVYSVLDGSGLANLFPITIQASQNIASYTSYTLNSPYASANFVFSGTQWYIMSQVGSFDGTIRTFPGGSRSTNTASAAASTAIGANNTASGINSIAGGSANTASGNATIALGSNSTASGANSVALGQFSNDRGRIGQLVFSSGRLTTLGDSQWGITVLRKTIAASGSGRLTSDGLTAGASNTVNLANGTAYGFGRITVVAYDPVNVKAVMWYVDGLLVIRGANAAATVLVGSPTVSLSQASASLSALVAGSLVVTADTTNGGVNFTVTNGTTVSIDVFATIQSTEGF